MGTTFCDRFNQQMVLKRKNSGLTLVEILVAMSILILLIAVVTGSINPIALMYKGKDARRKKDLTRIKVAFEEYINDEGCYPGAAMVAMLNDPVNCNSNVFEPWLPIWPCDPNGRPYHVYVEDDGCPEWFKILAQLENDQDEDIPAGWYPSGSVIALGDGTITSEEVNYGTSSTNVSWFDVETAPACVYSGQCFYDPPGDATCNVATIDLGAGELPGCMGSNCYTDNNCSPICRVSCCGAGCD